jgi:Domain of unknown function (DUF4845)
MRNREKGVTAIGWVFLLTPLVILGYAAIRLTPVYLNYMKVTRAMEQAATDNRGASDAQQIRTAIDRHFEIDMVEFPTIKDISIKRDGTGWLLEAAYDDEVPLFGNVSLHVSFDKKVRTVAGGRE